MRIAWEESAWNDYLWWQKQDRRILKRINELIRDTIRDPYAGIGKPERLKYLEGAWSRRITDEHRLVYYPEGDLLIISQVRHHY
ncbi:MAG: Txe/YoeB family addiction module toxin [Clostridia bacterium]|nr:Txe/YoeB family addiction module toxin [Clostridia bacterium]